MNNIINIFKMSGKLNKNFNKIINDITLEDKLLELARDRKGLPIIKVTIQPPDPNNKYVPTNYIVYKFWKNDKFPYGQYFYNGEWFTNTRCSDDINKALGNMMKLHFPDGNVTKEACDKEVIIRKDFSYESMNKYYDGQTLFKLDKDEINCGPDKTPKFYIFEIRDGSESDYNDPNKGRALYVKDIINHLNECNEVDHDAIRSHIKQYNECLPGIYLQELNNGTNNGDYDKLYKIDNTTSDHGKTFINYQILRELAKDYPGCSDDGFHYLCISLIGKNKVVNLDPARLVFDISFIKSKNFSESIITPEMENYFRKYVKNHINNVIDVAKKLLDKGYITINNYRDILNHDKSKLEEPEYTPYVKRKWQEKINAGSKLGDYHNMDDDIKMAIVHHVTNNDHHPEFWSKDYQGFKSDDPCHIDYMPEACIIEMACDWKAMGDEHGNTTKDWFKKTSGSRWIWSHDLANKIQIWLNIVDNL